MTVTDISFPALVVFDDGGFLTYRDENRLTSTNALGLKKGCYNGLLIIGSDGMAVRTKGARKLHGIGRFWGYNLFFNRWIKVELIFDGEPFLMDTEELKQVVLKHLHNSFAWQDYEGIEHLIGKVEKAKNAVTIVRLVTSTHY
jgi:hypothetical protein